VSVFYLIDSAEALPLWDSGLEGNPYLSVNISVGLGLGWLLRLVLGRRECQLSLVLFRRDMDLIWISFLLTR